MCLIQFGAKSEKEGGNFPDFYVNIFKYILKKIIGYVNEAKND